MKHLNYVNKIKDALLRRTVVQTITGLSRSSLYAAIKDGTFPSPLKIGKRAVAWRTSDINTWIANQTANGGDVK
jgi:prophage regulatory protein